MSELNHDQPQILAPFPPPSDLPLGDTRLPGTRAELHAWIHDHLGLPPDIEEALNGAIDSVVDRQEHQWRQSKDEAIKAVMAGVAERMATLKHALERRDETVSHISHYFERLVGDLTDKARRDPKTKLMNFERFVEQLVSFLALEQRTRWAAVGLADISGFKWYNDALGHAVGDLIIERVAAILGEQIRSDRLGAQDSVHGLDRDLHARFGGDEFCFLIPNLADYSVAWLIAERFRDAVERHDWGREDPRLAARPVRVDVGVVCLRMGPVAERRSIAARLAKDLLQHADTLMYDAKAERVSRAVTRRVRLRGGELVDIPARGGTRAGSPRTP